MKKVHNFLFFLLAFVTINAISLEIDYNLMNSPDDVVRNETRAIDLLPANDHEKLSDAYACRGESLLLSDNFEGALEDFQKSYDHSLQIHSKHSQLSAIFRALFGQAIIYGCLNRPEMFEQISESLLDIIQLAKCSSHAGSLPIHSATNSRLHPLPLILCEATVLYGPDEMSMLDCLDLVDNTVFAARVLINKAPASARSTLLYVIDQLAKEARACCRAGGLWKGCFQQLANKYHQWNQKWKVFGIPPDPSWD